MSTRSALLALAVTACFSAGCAFHTTARAWHGRVGPDGDPVFYTSTTKVGLKAFVVVPWFGNTEIDGIVADLTEHIASIGGDQVRLVEGNSENYWYGFPPVTWIFTPVISKVSAEFRPSADSLYQWSDVWAGPPVEPQRIEGGRPAPDAEPQAVPSEDAS